MVVSGRFFKRIKFSSKKQDRESVNLTRSWTRHFWPKRSAERHDAASGPSPTSSPMDAAATAGSKTQLIVVVLFVIVYSNTYRLKKAQTLF